jgi:hypothetical protein
MADRSKKPPPKDDPSESINKQITELIQAYKEGALTNAMISLHAC